MSMNRELLIGVFLGVGVIYAWCYMAGQGQMPWPIQLNYDKIGQARTFGGFVVPRADNPGR